MLRFAIAMAVLLVVPALLVVALAAPPAAPAHQHLRIVGGLAGVNQYTRYEEPFWTRELPRLSNGRASAEIVPFDRAGLRPAEMLRLVQLGAVPFGPVNLAQSATLDPELIAVDLAGLNTDMASLRRTVAAFRPTLHKLLRERYGVELLALYVQPAQVTFCKRPLRSLADLSGRRVRVSSPTQADWVGALGAVPVSTGFSEIVAGFASGNLDCAITGTMSGNTIGLHEVTSHMQTTAVNWGLSAFVAHGAAWKALPADLQALLGRELPKLEIAIWSAAQNDTGDGIACNVGAASCAGGRHGGMVEVKESAADAALRREAFASGVLPAWMQRCGPSCKTLWRQTVGPAAGIELR